MVDAALVAPPGEVGAQEGRDAGPGHVAADQSGPERKHVRVIMLPGERGGHGIVDAGAAAGRVAVDCDGNSNARTADGDTPISVAGCDRLGQPFAELRIIDALVGVGAEIGHVMPLLTEPARKLILQAESGMVRGECDFHLLLPLAPPRRFRHPRKVASTQFRVLPVAEFRLVRQIDDMPTAYSPLIGLSALSALASATVCQAQSAPRQRAGASFAPAETRTLRDFGAIGDARADDTAAVSRALVQSDRYCLDGGGRAYRVSGTLRVGKNLCLRNLTLIQAAVPVNTAAFIRQRCPSVLDPAAVIDCKDPAVPPSQFTRLWQSLSVRTLLIRPDGDRPIRVNLHRVKVDRGPYAEHGSRTDSAGIWLDGADRVDFRDVEITGNGKGYGLFISNASNVTLTNLWVHDLVWAPYPGDKPLSRAAVAAMGWNSVPIHEFREQRSGRPGGKFYGVRIQEQLSCVSLANVKHVRIENVRIQRCMARFDTGDLPWQADGLNIGQSSVDVVINGGTIESTWEGVDVVAGGAGIDGLRINGLTIADSFSYGLKMGYQLRNASVSGLSVRGAGLAGVVLSGPVRGVGISRASIQQVGVVRGREGPYTPWPRGNRAGIRLDGAPGSAPESIVIEDVRVSGRPAEFEFGVLNTGGRGIQLTRFRAEGFGNEQAHGVNPAG